MAQYIRHLSAGETISDMVHAYGADVVQHVALVRSKVPITRQMLDHTVSVLVNFQPALDICITSEKGPHGNGSHFILGNMMRDVEVIEASSRKAWVGIAEVELSRPFNSLFGPLWKLKYVRFGDIPEEELSDAGASEQTHEGAILFTIHQALVDGVCMFDLLYRQLIAILNGIIDRGDLSIFQNPIPLLPPCEVAFSKETLNPSKNSFKEPATLKQLTQKHQSLFRPLFTCVGNGPPIGPSVTRLLPFMLPTGATRQLIEKCYEHRISPKSILITAAAMSLGITAADHNITMGDMLTVCLPVDLRHYRPMSKPQPLGNWLGFDYINIVKQRNNIDLSFFWRDAQKVHENLLHQRQGWLNLTTAKNFFDHHQAIMKKIAKEQTIGPTCNMYKAHFALFDLGNCDLMTGDNTPPQDNPFDQNSSMPNHSQTSNNSRHSRDAGSGGNDSVRMSEHYFTSSMSDVTTIPLSLTVCTYRSRLMWTLAYNGRWISKSFATRFIDRMLATIHQLISEPRKEEDMFDMPMTNGLPGGRPANAPYQPQSNTPYPQQSNSPYPQQSNAPYPQQSNAPYPRQSNAPFPQQSNVPYPQQSNAPYPQQSNAPYPRQSNAPYPQQSNAPYPQQSNAPYPQQSNAPYPQQSNAPFPQQSNAPYPQQSNVPYPQQSNAPYPQPSNAPYPQQSSVPPPPPPPPPPPGGIPPAMQFQTRQPPKTSPSGSTNRSGKAEDINKLPPFIRMQRMKIGSD